VLLYYLVPSYGAYGALSALLIACCVRTTIFISVAHILYPRRFMFKEVIWLCIFLITSFYFGYQIVFESTVLCFILKSVVVFLFIILGLFTTFGYRRIMAQLSQITFGFWRSRSAAN